jgi:hypothetical protein
MNSEKRIIYKTSTGSVRIIVPADNINMTVEEIAQKDVPTGIPYKIVNASEISSDRTFRNAWDIDETELIDGTGANHGVLEE